MALLGLVYSMDIYLTGPALAKNKFIVAINWTGITFLDERERRLLELSYPEVTGVNTMRYVESVTACEDIVAYVLFLTYKLRLRMGYFRYFFCFLIS